LGFKSEKVDLNQLVSSLWLCIGYGILINIITHYHPPDLKLVDNQDSIFSSNCSINALWSLLLLVFSYPDHFDSFVTALFLFLLGNFILFLFGIFHFPRHLLFSDNSLVPCLWNSMINPRIRTSRKSETMLIAHN